MGECCDPNAPKPYYLKVDEDVVGLIGVEQSFLDVSKLDLADEEVAEKLLEIVEKRNYIPQSAREEFKTALFKQYKNYFAKKKQIFVE